MRGTPVIAAAAMCAALTAGCGLLGDGAEEVTEAPSGAVEEPSQSASSETPSELVDAPSEPVASERVYEVRSGDTLTSIAERFDTTVEAIVEANDVADPDVIDVGQRLTIPQS